MIAAFFAAHGIRLTTAEAEAIAPAAGPRGHFDREALRRVAQHHHRRLGVLKADERFLWEELGRNRPLLVLLPDGLRYRRTATPLIPVAWDQEQHVVKLLDGTGRTRTLAEETFFGLRAPLKHAALCLIDANRWRRDEPAREQKLLLADFWYDESFYRRVDAVYTAIQDEPPDMTDAADLMRHGNNLICKGNYARAATFFRTALTLEPNNPKILNNLAYAMLNGGGELLAALRHAGKANTLDPGNPLILETIGSINLRLGDAECAVKYLEQAWARALRQPDEIQIAIMDQLVRAWLAADHRNLAWQVAAYRHRTFPEYKFPPDILEMFPALRRARLYSEEKIPLEGG